MASAFVSHRTSRLYEAPTGQKWHMVLIFGDEVEITGPPVSGRVPAVFRGRPGFIREDQLGPQPALELYFIDVGQGDATYVVTPARTRILVDGGVNRRALGFLAWKYRLDQPDSSVDIDLLVLTHADEDHLNGLVPIITHPQINVRRVIHSGIATFASGAFGTSLGDLDPTGTFLVTRHNSPAELNGLPLSTSFSSWHAALLAEGASCAAVDASSGTVDLGDPAVTADVIGPRLDTVDGHPAYRWFRDASHTINGHSVVLRLNYNRVSILLSGDLNSEGAAHLLGDPALAAKMDAHVFKAPHHGSHEFYPPFLWAIRPQISIISSGDDPDHGHPRAIFVGGVGVASRSKMPLVFSTEIAATFVEAGEEAGPREEVRIGGNLSTVEANARARILFKRRLHGMINVRTDGRMLYAARRVAAGYWWESYGPMATALRPSD